MKNGGFHYAAELMENGSDGYVHQSCIDDLGSVRRANRRDATLMRNKASGKAGGKAGAGRAGGELKRQGRGGGGGRRGGGGGLGGLFGGRFPPRVSSRNPRRALAQSARAAGSLERLDPVGDGGPSGKSGAMPTHPQPFDIIAG